jgi:hypothetical protein
MLLFNNIWTLAAQHGIDVAGMPVAWLVCRSMQQHAISVVQCAEACHCCAITMVSMQRCGGSNTKILCRFKLKDMK